jgi:GldM N-terminal domain
MKYFPLTLLFPVFLACGQNRPGQQVLEEFRTIDQNLKKADSLLKDNVASLLYDSLLQQKDKNPGLYEKARTALKWHTAYTRLLQTYRDTLVQRAGGTDSGQLNKEDDLTIAPQFFIQEKNADTLYQFFTDIKTEYNALVTLAESRAQLVKAFAQTDHPGNRAEWIRAFFPKTPLAAMLTLLKAWQLNAENAFVIVLKDLNLQKGN